LTARGCAALLDPRCDQALLFDIGGGSIELALVRHGPGRRPEIQALASLPAGVVDLAERYGHLKAGAVQAMAKAVYEPLAAFAATPGLGAAVAAGRVQMLGTSGTVTTLAAVHLGLALYDRRRVDGSEIDFAAIAELSARLGVVDAEMRARIPCIGRERADLVVAGCAVLNVICRLFPVGRLTVADRGIREGMLLTLIDGEGGSPPAVASVRAAGQG
jgi:exopolyphosphatase/guanosine-5'-triphosphate,3'-diphosphate pyrophosphatase